MEYSDTSGQARKDNEKLEVDKNLAIDSLKMSQHENTHAQLLSELVETERRYIQDLEEVMEKINHPKKAF